MNADMLAQARALAEYWLKGSHNADSRAEAQICAENSANVWKNAAYAMARRCARASIIEAALATFPDGHDEAGIYTEWKAKLDAALTRA